MSIPDTEAARTLGPDRRQQMLELIYRLGSVHVEELSEHFGISKVTVRADLDQLAERDLVARARGGAVSLPGQTMTAALSERSAQNKQVKRRIAQAAAELLRPNETIILDAGSTVYRLSRLITQGEGLTVVTPALNVATQLGGIPGVDVILVGGHLNPRDASVTGAMAEYNILEMPAHRAFLGAHGIDTYGDIVDVSQDVARVKRAMVRAANEVILLADSSKWGVAARSKVIEMSAITTVITDDGISDDARRAIEAAGAQLVLA